MKYSAAHWDESGADKTSKIDNTRHAVGTYQVTIPTAITYTGMNVGTVNTSDDYQVNVRGAISDGYKVTLTAETGKTVSNNGTESQITETTTQGKTEWSVDDCYGSENADGSINGTDCTDNIKMSGTAKTTGTYTGTVKYIAEIKTITIAYLSYIPYQGNHGGDGYEGKLKTKTSGEIGEINIADSDSPNPIYYGRDGLYSPADTIILRDGVNFNNLLTSYDCNYFYLGGFDFSHLTSITSPFESISQFAVVFIPNDNVALYNALTAAKANPTTASKFGNISPYLGYQYAGGYWMPGDFGFQD